MPGHIVQCLFEKYVIDANVILNFWIINNDEPLGKDVHTSAWAYLEKKIEEGNIITPLSVRAELIKHGGQDLHEWVKAHEEMFVPLGIEVRTKLKEISKLHPIYKTTNGSIPDATIVALAGARGLCVITSEKHEAQGNRSTRNPKIPNVCEDFNIEWTSANGFFRKEGQSF